MATVTAVPKKRIAGGSFLLEEGNLETVFTPEDFTEQQQLIVQTTEEFATNEITPAEDKIESKDWSVTRELLKKASDLGLTSVDVPEEYGGVEMDKVTSAIIADRIAKSGSFAVSFGGHVGIGTLPIVYFGTEDQKKKYLPKLASGEWVGAYALSENSSGSDALNCRAKAVLSPDGQHYVLNGEKMWITNAHFADLFILFAKVDGEKFTAFIVEKEFPGFSVGAEEHKMGIRGSSTAPLILNDCQVPVENVLGDIGKGHVIAFNILNVGRFKLAAFCVGGARSALQSSIKWARDRKAFGKTIADFGLIREKIAQMAVGVYVGESMVYRTVGMMDVALGEIDKKAENAAKLIRDAIEEYAVECSLLKVWGSEMLDMVVDEQVQIYGGYGFVEEYPAERAYRDARVNRIFEGTNEINRMLVVDRLTRNAMSGKLPLMAAIKKLTDEIMGGPSSDEFDGALAEERRTVANAKKLSLFCAGVAIQKYMMGLKDHQEVLASLADLVTECYAMDSALLRAQKILASHGEAAARLPIAMAQIYNNYALDRVAATAKKVLAEVAEGDMLRTYMTILRRLTKSEPVNVIALQEQVAERTIDIGKYVTA